MYAADGVYRWCLDVYVIGFLGHTSADVAEHGKWPRFEKVPVYTPGCRKPRLKKATDDRHAELPIPNALPRASA